MKANAVEVIGPKGIERYDLESFDTVQIITTRDEVPGERVWRIEATKFGLEIQLSDRGGRMERVVIQPESANLLRLTGVDLEGIA